MPKLSICIATLNRADFIGETLTGILAQVTPEVELVVVDGASTDGTGAVVLELFDGRPRCRYIRLPRKGGVDRDYCRAVDEASGEFCWLMTDDDVLRPDAVRTVLGLLTQERDLVVVNAEVAGPDLLTTYEARRAPVAQDQEFGPDQQADLLAVAGNLLSFIGAVVVRRSVWQARDRASYFGTEFVHVGVIFQRPLAGSTRLVADPLVRIRYGNAQWAARAFEIWMEKWPALIWSFSHLRDDAKVCVCPKEPWRRFPYLLDMKIRGCFTQTDYRKHLAGKTAPLLSKMCAYFLAIFPDVLFNALARELWVPLRRLDKIVSLELEKSRFNYRRQWF
ncbi:glycosyltransferase family 2 protein [Frigoriglobus tundricola]|uniref:GT2 family glycosyltransferase n=1 Tax=Frigoriglobus tundricola TaxID=2774151 RepID=A0A6M5Z3Y0_9BACT|nr:glycosyltransferase family 2 protein [Frigoriglobus tundricola]QJX00477.1 GT2 family glycosyltransferase [Frigoriglobus tundricola]